MNEHKARKLASKNGTLDTTTSGTLRRRAKDLRDEGYNDQYVACLERGADELAHLTALHARGAQHVIDLVSDNIRLRQCIDRMKGRLKMAPIQKPLREMWLNDLKAVTQQTPRVGETRQIMTVEISRRTGVVDRATVEADVKQQLDTYYELEAPNGDDAVTIEIDEEAPDGERATDGEPTAEQPGPAAGDRGAEGTRADEGSEARQATGRAAGGDSGAEGEGRVAAEDDRPVDAER